MAESSQICKVRFCAAIMFFLCLFQQSMLGQWEISPATWNLPVGTQFLLVDGEKVGVTMPFAAPKSTDTWRSEFEWKYSMMGEKDFHLFPGSETVCVTQVGKFFSAQKAGKSRIVIERNQTLEWLDTQGISSNDIHPFYDDKSHVLVFASDREGGKGGYDLYKMILTNKGWSSPVPLPENINTSKDEKFPMISNGDLYFSSPTEKGDWDIFHSPKSEFWQVRWQLEYPINSERDDYQWWPSDEESGWLISNRASQGIHTALFYAERLDPVQRKQICLETDSTVECSSLMQGQAAKEVGKRFCFHVGSSHFYSWTFTNGNGTPQRDMPVTIKDGQGNVVAVLYTDDKGQMGWQYLPFAFNGIQWWNEQDQSHLLASADKQVFVAVESVDSTEVFFETGSSEISEMGQKELLQMAFYLMLNDDREVWIRGSADPTGNVLLNEKLAWERAWKVQNFLLAHGVLVGQMNVEIIDPLLTSSQDLERKVSLSIR